MGKIDHIIQPGLESECFCGWTWKRRWEDKYKFSCSLNASNAISLIEAFYLKNKAKIIEKNTRELKLSRGSTIKGLFSINEKSLPHVISIEFIDIPTGGSSVTITYAVKLLYGGGLRFKPYDFKKEVETLLTQLSTDANSPSTNSQ